MLLLLVMVMNIRWDLDRKRVPEEGSFLKTSSTGSPKLSGHNIYVTYSKQAQHGASLQNKL